jgi:DNA-binding transcriptional LysR family regulator
LSKQLKALEERYKVKLIEGVRPPLTLTNAGQALFERAQALFGIADEIDVLLGEDDLESGVILRLGTDSPPFAAEFMAEFLEKVPQTRFRVTIANALQTNELLMKAQVDVAIICEPKVDPDYSYVPLYQDRLVAIVPASWSDDGRTEFSLESIADLVLLVREASSRTLAATKRLLTDATISLGRTMELHTREMIREGVAHGLGISLMFERECPPDSRIRILPIQTSSTAVKVEGYLAIRTERRRMPLMKAALKVAAEMRMRT